MKKQGNQISLSELVNFLDKALLINSVPSDSSNNGLQVEGSPYVRKALFAVDACLNLFNYAAENDFDFIFVHHGLSWGNELARIMGLNAKRLSGLMKNDISLYAAHLPLDAHSELGHNAIIARKLGLQECRSFANFANVSLGVGGSLEKSLTVEELCKTIDKLLDTKTKIIAMGKRKIRKIVIIAGSGGYTPLLEAHKYNLDCYITGEISHSCYHLAQESGLTVICAGHYATEKLGVMAVMNTVGKNFPIYCEFRSTESGF